jgi:hypothetical protein
MLCSSVRKKGAIERCNAKALPGYMLCGRHSKCKHVIFWVNPYSKHVKHIIHIQSIIRGWLLRKRLALSGPGVLCRKHLANVEDVETCTEYNREHPFSYFSFLENDKIYWFNFNTLWKWSMMKVEPKNPYTNMLLTQDTLKRLRAIWTYNYRHDLTRMPVESKMFGERVRGRWNIISQIFNANGFGLIAMDHWLHFTKRDYIAIFRMIKRDLSLLNVKQDADHCMEIVRLCLYEVHRPGLSYILMSLNALMEMLNTVRDQYSLSFLILSAMYRC